MEKRLIIAFILSFAVLYGYQALFSPPAEPLSEPASTAVASPPFRPAESPSPDSGAAPPIVEKPENGAATTDVEAVAEKAEPFVIDSALYTATISNQGGTLRSFKLKSYKDGEGNPLELISQAVATKVGWPLVLVTGDSELDRNLAEALFVGRLVDDRLTLEFSSGGVSAKKTLIFNPMKYEFSIQTSVSRNGSQVPHTVAWQGDFGDQSIPRDPLHRNAVYQSAGKFHRVNVGKIEDLQSYSTTRAGVEDQYFLAMFLSGDLPGPVQIKKQEYSLDGKDPLASVFLAAAVPDGPGLRVYVGPKDRVDLSQVDPQLAAVIDYGWFEFVAKPLIAALLWIHSYIGNFGWAIIILTLAINVALFPLRIKQQLSMLKMQKIQPHMKRLQDQYKKLKPNDPKRADVQSEMMGLYKQHGVNPMGGCLPLLLQMPVLFGFYSALYYSIELRRAPWMLWIKDLSQYDPYFVLPILMAVSMLAMSKLTPTTVDPTQAKMMMIMPLMFTVLFIYQSSGLVLYWLTSNVAGIAQQVFINKYWAPSQAEKKAPSKSKPKVIPGK